MESPFTLVAMSLAVRVQSVAKQYPGVRALDDVSLEFSTGKIRGLVGENGAGKSTLIKILAGVLQPDQGRIVIDDEEIRLSGPQEARQHGIAVVHQHSHMIPDLSVAENHALRIGYARDRLGNIHWSTIVDRAAQAIEVLIPRLDVQRAARTLSDVEKQLVELSFALSEPSRLLILDEPTAALPGHEAELLHQKVRQVASRGTSVLFVSHRLDEVLQLADGVTVLRDGRHVWTKPSSAIDRDQLIQGMVGRAVTFQRDSQVVPEENIVFEVHQLSDVGGAYQDVSFQLRRGEIYGIYGLVGAGQAELCGGLFGLRKCTDDQLQNVSLRRGYVPADRNSQGIFHRMTVGENLSIANLKELSSSGTLNLGTERDKIDASIQNLLVKTTGPDQAIVELSGGNQQKVLVGRWLMTEPKVLVLEEPTQGVDVAAKGQIYDIIRDLARRGMAIIVMSSEIPELQALAHRIGVMREGRLVSEFDAESASEDELLRASLPESEPSDTRVAPVVPDRGWKIALQWLAARREMGLAIFILLVLGLCSALVPNFATAENLRDVMLNNVVVLIGALGMTMVILAAGIDVSLGAILGLSAVAAGKMAQFGWHPAIVFLAPLALGAILGAFNGGLTVWGRVHSIVVTLGTMLVFRGLLRLWTGGYQLINLPPEVTWVRDANILGLPALLGIGIGALAFAHWLLTYTKTGRSLYVLGSSRESASYLGVRPRQVLPVAFALCGMLGGLAGLVWAGRLGQVQIAVGEGFELTAIAAAVVGGTHIMGGRGTALGTCLGAIFLGIVHNVLILTKIPSYWQQSFFGAMILAALVADSLLSSAERTDR